MSKQLQSLIAQVQQSPPSSADQQQGIVEIVNIILAQRCVGRRSPTGQLSGVYLDILQTAQQELEQILTSTIDQWNPGRISPDVWSKAIREQTFRLVLNSERLQQLALAAQAHSPKTATWQYAITELVSAIRLSGKLNKPASLTSDQYRDVENRTLLWLCEHLKSYDATRGEFIKWLNYRLHMIAREVQQEQKDPYTQTIWRKILQNKRQLKGLIQQTQLVHLQQWLLLYLRKILSNSTAIWAMGILVVLLAIASLLGQALPEGDALLFKMAEALINAPAQVVAIEDLNQVDTLTQPDISPSFSDLIRHYIETDPKGLCQKAIRDFPEVTFQVVALSYLNGESWKEMAQRLGPQISTLSNHYQRTLKVLIPEIRQFVQDNS